MVHFDILFVDLDTIRYMMPNLYLDTIQIQQLPSVSRYDTIHPRYDPGLSAPVRLLELHVTPNLLDWHKNANGNKTNYVTGKSKVKNQLIKDMVN